MIYSSGRESFFNLNSTWYDPSGSWLDTRRTPFRYGYANCCSSGCHGEGAEGMRGHDYRHYGYRQPVCSERCQGYGSSGSCHGYGSSGSCHGCVRRPSYGYGSSGGCQGYGGSVCSERCHGSSGQGYGRSVCSERCHGSSGGAQGYGGSVCSERCHGSGYRGGKASYGKVSQCIPQSSPNLGTWLLRTKHEKQVNSAKSKAYKTAQKPPRFPEPGVVGN
ncbi:keratin, type I cytoskeletal 10-like [Myiozetetes cayanensis]|uniref:keratin, type I cytoskeletal 10-like n=1 Tax=Myiozetetes cayanensis TaxID=478635 RepID=UPI0021609266|nr:keratin, type I cytoskeletal 10-like [Myiozetetes cayanensis]